ncbi:MAG: stage III sporulation protein AD [Clostridiales bacterium]|jgi:stage III sporulation protein AD|nr:stage III sporulation protein AD [Clostridiales bacterium]
MDIVQIAAVGIIAAILSLAVKKHAPEISLVISIAAGLLIFMMILPRLSAVIEVIREIGEAAGANGEYVSVIVKIIGISYIAEFASQICADSGENAIASKIEAAGKVFILIIAAPILLSLLNMIFSLL